MKSSLLNRIKEDLRNDNLCSALSLLSDTDDIEIFKDFKAHKLLLIPRDNVLLVSAYETSAIGLYRHDEKLIQKERNYLLLIDSFIKDTNEIKAEVIYMLAPFLTRSLKEFLCYTDTVIAKILAFIMKSFDEENLKFSPEVEHEQFSNLSGVRINNLRGSSVDTIFAAGNLINIFAARQRNEAKSNSAISATDEELDILTQALYLCGYLNSYQYALDKIAYDEWQVIKVDQTKEKPIFHFEFTDFRLQQAREIGLQRISSDFLRGRLRERWLKKLFEPFILAAFSIAWEYYQELADVLVTGRSKFENSKPRLLNLLDELDAEDELLIGFNIEKVEVFSSYASYIAIMAFTYAANALKGKSKVGNVHLTCPILPLELISEFLSGLTIAGIEIIDATEQFITDLPLTHHIGFFKTPCVRNSDGKVFALEHFLFSNWVKSVRGNLMHGGSIADRIGKSWEGYIAHTLAKYDWENPVTIVKIKINGNPVTDIDLIAKKENLLLIAQIKTYYGSNINQFEQWKYRQKLIHGVEQVKKGMTAIANDKKILRSYFKEKDLRDITLIKPVVITNAHMFNGWEYDGVTIMSSGSLMQILNNATVQFMLKDKSVISKKHYGKSPLLTTEEIVDFIDRPLDWRIGPPEVEIVYHTENFKKSTMVFPSAETKEITF